MWRRPENTQAALAVFQEPPSSSQIRSAAASLVVLAVLTGTLIFATWRQLLPEPLLLPLLGGYIIFNVGYLVSFITVSRFTKPGKIGDLGAALNISAMLLFKHWLLLWTAISVMACLAAFVGAILLLREAKRMTARPS